MVDCSERCRQLRGLGPRTCAVLAVRALLALRQFYTQTAAPARARIPFQLLSRQVRTISNAAEGLWAS